MGLFDDLKNALSGGPPPEGYFIIGADKQEYGPYSKEDIIEYLNDGRLNWDTLVRLGEGDWKEIQDHPGFPSPPGPPPKVGRSGQPTQRPRKPRKKKKSSYQAPSADGTIVIEYLNYAGELKQFIGDPKSIRRRGNHFSIRVAPTFKRISLNRSKTRILQGVPAPQAMPTEAAPVRTTTADTSILQYTNFEGVQKDFKIITGVVDDKGDYVRVRVSPTFKYITLKRTRIGNPEALFEATTTAPPQQPTAASELTAPQPQPEPEAPSPAAAVGTVAVVLTGCGLGTFDATNALRDVRPDLGTFDLYNLLRNFPQTVAENVPAEQAQEMKKRLEDAGCTVELQ